MDLSFHINPILEPAISCKFCKRNEHIGNMVEIGNLEEKKKKLWKDNSDGLAIQRE